MKRSYLALFLLLFACQAPSVKQEKPLYPDLKAIFQAEMKKLNAENPSISKEVRLNNRKETKTVSKIDWGQELALFLESDINKVAYRGLYEVKIAGNTATYSATSDKLRTRWLKITKNEKGMIGAVAILNRTENALYHAEESLGYYPDSLYRISKYQKIILSAPNRYFIQGKLK